MSEVVEIWIFAGLGVMVLLLLMGGMARLYRKAGVTAQASSCYGLGGTAWCRGHGTMVRPMVQICKDRRMEMIVDST